MSADSGTTDAAQATRGALERGVPDDGGSDRSRWLAVYVLCVGMLMIVLDATIVNVALPSIQQDLRFSTSSLAWVVNAYLIAFGGLLLLAGRLGDLIGRRRMFLAGVALFTGASLLCGAAQAAWWLVAARFVQGVGGAMTSAVILGMIVTMFSDARAQAKAIGVFAFVASAGGSVGLLAGGVLTQLINWHWIFFVNLPIGIATALAARRLVPDEPGIGLREGADVPGALLITSALMLGVYTIVGPAARLGWGSSSTLLFGAGSIALLAAFLVRETRAASPLMPLRIFRSRPVAAANAIQILSVAGMFGMFFLGALYLRRVLGYDALEIGLAFLPVTIAMGTLSIRYSERIFIALGARRALLAGLTLVLAGLVVFALAPVHADYATQIAPSMLLLGLGAGTAFPALMNLAMSGATPQDAGLASGLVNTTAQVGGALGLAVLATLSTSRSTALIASGHPIASALTTGYHLAFWVAAALVGCALAVVLAAVDPGRAPAGAHGAAHASARTQWQGPRSARRTRMAVRRPKAREGSTPALPPKHSRLLIDLRRRASRSTQPTQSAQRTPPRRRAGWGPRAPRAGPGPSARGDPRGRRVQRWRPSLRAGRAERRNRSTRGAPRAAPSSATAGRPSRALGGPFPWRASPACRESGSCGRRAYRRRAPRPRHRAAARPGPDRSCRSRPFAGRAAAPRASGAPDGGPSSRGAAARRAKTQ